MSELLTKIRSKTARLAVVGLGYVGLPLALEKAAAGYEVCGVDRDEKRVRTVLDKTASVAGISADALQKAFSCGRFGAGSDFDVISSCDAVCLCVPTPLDGHGAPDLSDLDAALACVVPRLKKGSLLILESTTYPGTTAERVAPAVERAGLRVGEDVLVAYSPERVDPGNLRWTVKNTPKVVGGMTDACAEAAAALYESVLDAPVVRVSSPAAAELEKLLENVYRNVNIALVNELAQLCERLNVSVWEVIAAAKTKPYGFSAFYPGLGPGGHCIPLDPWYLAWKAREYGFHTSLIENAGRINDEMPLYIVRRVTKNLSRRGIALNGARILLLGAAYKADVADARESPAVRLAALLEEEGARVTISDPLLGSVTVAGRERVCRRLPTPSVVHAHDIVVVGAAHACFDRRMIAAHAKAIFDTKNAFAEITSRENIELL